MASEAILKYLVDTNRPYSCADVTVNLRGAYSKTIVQKNLDALAESGKIRCKLYGKQKVYAAVQPENQEPEGNIEDYDAQFKNLTQTLDESTAILKTTEANFKNLVATPTTPSAKILIDQINERLYGLETKLSLLRNSTEVISADEKKAIMVEHEKLLKEYRKRKRISSEMMEAIMEGYNNSKKALIDELCIETDEMVEFKLITNT